MIWSFGSKAAHNVVFGLKNLVPGDIDKSPADELLGY